LRRALLIAAFLVLAAPADTLAQERATVKLSSQPDKVKSGDPWHVVLTIKQPGRAPRADLTPSIEVRDADGFSTTYRAVAMKKPGRYKTTVAFPKSGQWTYAIRDGLSATPPRFRSVVIKDAAPVVDRPDPVGPPGLPIAFAGLLVLGAAGYFLMKRHRQGPSGPAHPA
jgi:YtkA-like protein